MGTANFGIAGSRLAAAHQLGPAARRTAPSGRAQMMKKHGLGAMLCMYDENVPLPHRHADAGLEPAQAGPALRACCAATARPILFEQGDLGFQIERHSPWIPKENVRHSFAWIKGAAGPASHSAGHQVHQGDACRR